MEEFENILIIEDSKHFLRLLGIELASRGIKHSIVSTRKEWKPIVNEICAGNYLPRAILLDEDIDGEIAGGDIAEALEASQYPGWLIGISANYGQHGWEEIDKYFGKDEVAVAKFLTTLS